MLTDAPAPPLDPDHLFAGLRDSRGLLLAVSGGPDSTALLLLIDRWRGRVDVPVSVGTVDHAFRANSRTEAEAVAALCAARGLPHRTLAASGQRPASGVQEHAREMRHALLADCAVELGADTIVTAHHADDQAETVLMRLLQGSGPAGLAGMSPLTSRGAVALARPLLDVPKDVLLALCRAEGVAFATDPSNDDVAFRRAQLRNLAPLLGAEGLDRDALLRLGRRAARSEAAVAWAHDLVRESAVLDTGPEHAVLSATRLSTLPEEVVLRLVREQVAKLSLSPLRLARMESLVAALRRAIDADQAFAATLGDATVRLDRGTVVIARAPPRRPVAD